MLNNHFEYCIYVSKRYRCQIITRVIIALNTFLMNHTLTMLSSIVASVAYFRLYHFMLRYRLLILEDLCSSPFVKSANKNSILFFVFPGRFRFYSLLSLCVTATLKFWKCTSDSFMSLLILYSPPFFIAKNYCPVPLFLTIVLVSLRYRCADILYDKKAAQRHITIPTLSLRVTEYW